MKSIKQIFLAVLLTFSTADFCLAWKVVLCERVAYDSIFFQIPEELYILAGSSRNNESDKISVQWYDKNNNSNTQILNNCDSINCNFLSCYTFGCSGVLSEIDVTNIEYWQNLTFNFYYNDIYTGSIKNNYFRIMDIPKSYFDINTKTITWKSVESASYYIVRIINGMDIDEDIIFQSERINRTSYILPLFTHELINKNAYYIEARDTVDATITGRATNSSIFVSMFIQKSSFISIPLLLLFK